MAAKVILGRRQYPREYNIWAMMIQRCTNPNIPNYAAYGGRGVKVFVEWKRSFPAWFRYMGPSPTNEHSIDRFPFPFGDYEPGNVRWATRREQTRNKRNNVWLEFNGLRLILRDWAVRLGINDATILTRLYRLHWSVEKTLTTPVDTSKRNRIAKG